MKHQQVTVDILKMIYSSCSYLMLAFVAWIFCKLFYACFWLPGHLKKQDEEDEKRKLENDQNQILENSDDGVSSDTKKLN